MLEVATVINNRERTFKERQVTVKKRINYTVLSTVVVSRLCGCNVETVDAFDLHCSTVNMH